MIMKFKSTLILIFILMVSLVGFSQGKPAQPELESGTIESQFDYIITKSTSFKDFQLIRKQSILKVKSNAIDSLKSIRKELVKSSSKTAGLNQQISSLQTEVSTLKKEIETISEDKDSINFLGKNMDKTAYVSMMWIVVAVLLIALIFFVLRFKSSFSTIKQTKFELEKVEGEYEEHRKKSLKKEQELMRKLQDEINKNTN